MMGHYSYGIRRAATSLGGGFDAIDWALFGNRSDS